MKDQIRKKRGRPKIPINWEVVEQLCAIQCTEREIAQVLDVSPDTLSRACQREKGFNFADYFDQKRTKGRTSLRRKQFEMVMHGSVTMAIWLGKQYLGQVDRQVIAQTNDPLAELLAEFRAESARLSADRTPEDDNATELSSDARDHE